MNRSQFLREAMPAVAVATMLGATAMSASAEQSDAMSKTERPQNKEIPEIRALLNAHDTAFTNHDLEGVLATYADGDAIVLMGTGPGELWSGKEEIKGAYAEMFKGFDKGQQNFEYKFRTGGIHDPSAWLTTAGVVKLKHEGKDHEFVLNLSLVLEKKGDAWKIVSLHYSNLPQSKEA